MKNFNLNIPLVFVCVFMLSSCKIEPEPIHYGKDFCEFCKMTIMDKKFGTELMTSKGKIHKFDDTGCMVKFMKSSNIGESDCKHIVFSTLNIPNNFISFKKAFFVKSVRLQSPMLGNIAAFESELEAQTFIKTDSTSESVIWTELNGLF